MRRLLLITLLLLSLATLTLQAKDGHTTAQPKDSTTVQPNDRTTSRPHNLKTLRPQDRTTAEPQWEKILYELTDYEDNTFTEDDYETLSYMEEHPLNINTATPDELQQLPFLTAAQIEDIVEYRDRHGAMLTLGELTLITSIDYASRQLLRCFTYAGGTVKKQRPSLKDILKYGRSELMVSLRQPLYNRKGDTNGYLGYNIKHSLRYTFDAGDRLRLGLLGSQDSGEPFFSYKNGMGYDHYSFFVQMRNTGILENLVAGHFRLQFGMGLVANTGFSLGKTVMLTTMGRQSTGARPSLSRSSANYMQGLAATLRIAKTVTASAFVSYRPVDATLSDSGTIRTIVTTGYHRTPTEMEKKNNSNSLSTGFNLNFVKSGFHVGTTAIYTHYNRNLTPLTTTLFRRYYAEGNDFVNVGVDYGYNSHAFTFNGETATDRHGAIATLNTVSTPLSEQLTLMAIYRYYSFKYTSVYANAFSDGGQVQNEHGVYLGLEWLPTRALRLNAYADYAHSPWARYRISGPSDSFDTMVSLSWKRKRLTLRGRYRLRLRYRDNDDKTALIRYNTHRARLAATYDLGGGWDATTQGDFSLTQQDGNERGYMVTESVNGQWRWLRLSASVNYFDTDSYDCRLYAYERGTLHTFSFPAFYGNGLRYAIMLRADILNHRLMAIAKIGVTDYFDRTAIGSGLQLIDGSSMADIDFQLRWKF